MNRLRHGIRIFIPVIIVTLLITAGCSPKTEAPATNGTVNQGSSAQEANNPASTNPGSSNPAIPESQPVAAEPGTTRVNPIPLNTLISVPGWDIKVLEFLRGEDALAIINTADWQAQPLPDGQEYALAKVYLKCTALDSNAHSLGIQNMFISGSSNILFPDSIDSWPQPEFLYEDMFTADEVEGWIDAIIPTAENNLMVVLNYEQDDVYTTRYFALQEGASLSLPPALAALSPNDLGVNYATPARVGEQVITPSWGVTILSFLSGAEAEAALGKDLENYTPPPAGTEYLLMQVKLQYLSKIEVPSSLGSANFYPVDPANGWALQVQRANLYTQADLQWLNKTLLPGAEVEGWVYVTIPTGSTQTLIGFDPRVYTSSQEEQVRYFILE